MPDRPRSLLAEFTTMLSGWDWDVALLQEVPPWWPAELARACGAVERSVLTSRNWLLPVRRFVAERRPDLIKSNGGGCNAILVRGATVVEHRHRRLRFRPERRVLHAVRLDVPGGLWIANVHATANPKPLAHADMREAGATLARWAGTLPVLFGGDCNVPDPDVPGFVDVGGHGIDRFFLRGEALHAVGPPRVLDHEGLSDHAPVRLEVRTS